MPFTMPKASQINFDVTNITDPLIRLNSGESGSADKDAGLVIERGSDTNTALIYDESANQFAVINTNETGTTSGNVTIASYADLKVNAIYGANIELGHASDTTIARSSSGVVTIEGNTILTTGNSDAPSTSTSSDDADFILVDDGGTMKKITPSNLGIGTGGVDGKFTSSTFTTAPASSGNFDLAKQRDQTGSVETPFTAGGTDAFGVALSEIYDMMEPIGSTVSVDLGAFS